jgi:nucleoside-diphosphate-sugar epimerase
MRSNEGYRGVPVVVLGASGFIGQWVARALAEEGAELFVVARDAAAGAALDRSGSRAELITCDLEQAADVRSLMDRLRPAVVFNLAGYGVDPTERDQTRAELVNTRLVEHIADALASSGNRGWAGQQMVHVGSALEYGDAGGSLSEETPPQPTTMYGQTKLAGTLALQSRCRSRGLRALTARLFTVYGAGEHSPRLLPTLLNARSSQTPIELTEGRQQRDFTYVEDVAEGLVRLGVSTASSPGAVVNLATGRLTSVRAFVETAADVLGIARARLRFGALATRSEEMRHDPVTIERLEYLISWRPPTAIADGIARASAWHDLRVVEHTTGCETCR